MSDWIEHNGKKYYAEQYLLLANRNSDRRGRERDKARAELEQARKELAREDKGADDV